MKKNALVLIFTKMACRGKSLNLCSGVAKTGLRARSAALLPMISIYSLGPLPLLRGIRALRLYAGVGCRAILL